MASTAVVRELTGNSSISRPGRLFESDLESAEFLLESLQSLHISHRESHRFRKNWKGGGKR
jgi:hypothetical protein